MLVSYLSDAPADLGRATLTLLRYPLKEVTCSWQDEPGEWRWIMHRAENCVRIEVLSFDETFSSLSDEHGEQVFMAECSLLRLATEVQGQLRKLLDEFGEPGYQEKWGHPFPMQTLRQLEAAVHEQKPFKRSKKSS
ncbi:MAG: hypothetical protein V4671_28315 [Armatimonadota bacterium]